jgi:hypothetical protein
MLDGMKARALGECPPSKNTPRRPIQQKLVHLDESGGLRNLSWWICVTGARRHTESAEGHCLTHLDFKRGDAARDFIQGRKQRDRVRNRGRAGWHRKNERSEERLGQQDDSFVRIHTSVRRQDKLNELCTARP